MKSIRQQKSWVVLFAIVLLFTACKGGSPTAPPVGGTPPGGGTTPPTTGVTLSLAASNADPLVDSSVVITATATQNGQPVPNGTAVEFTTTAGTLDGGGTSLLKTTTNGVATVTLTSGTPGPVRVTATVGSATRSVDVTFRARPVTPPPPSRTPTITSVTPNVGRPSGGETLRITGTNFRAPVRVLLDIGRPQPVEAFVVSVTENVIEAITPAVDLGAGQQLEADVIVITEAGTPDEQRVEQAGAFIFRSTVLTPRISTATPNSGPVTGGTRVSIFGDGFQAPVQVLFGAAEARVITVHFSEIVVEAPTARDTSPNGSGTVTGPVDVTVRNINSQTTTTLPGGFRYIAAMQITAAGPTEGPFSGGTRVSIDGIGFVAPVAVTIAGVAAQPIEVTGTKIIAITSGVDVTGCADVTGPIVVTNIVNGDQATGPTFRYRVLRPVVVGAVPSAVTAGENVDVIVGNAQAGIVRIKLGNRTVFPTAVNFNNSTATYRVPVPTNFEFPTEECVVGGVTGQRRTSITVDLTYENVTTGCSDTAEEALIINPPDTTCVLPPPPAVATNPTGATCANVGNVAEAGSATGSATITVTNTAAAGSQSLTISSASVTGTNGNYSIAPASATIPPGGSSTFTVTVDPTAVGPLSGTATFATNVPTQPTVTVCVTGTGT